MADRFRLARVLRLRTQLRRQSADETARVATELVVLREDIAAARERQMEARAAEDAAAERGVTGAELVGRRAYAEAEAAHEQTLLDRARRVAELLTRCRDKLLTRRREERQLEKLREKAVGREAVAEERAAHVLIDDLVLRRRERR